MHASFQSPEAIARMKKMGILADTQSQWLYHDGPALEKVFGHARNALFLSAALVPGRRDLVAAGSDHMIGHDKNRGGESLQSVPEHVDRGGAENRSRARCFIRRNGSRAQRR